jgi:hypothetical protein
VLRGRSNKREEGAMKRSLVSALIFVVCLIAPQIAAATTASSEARLSQTVIVHGETWRWRR